MAIKKLQNNYTTPEQSKRLLELGVPADSADCYHVVKNNFTAILHNEAYSVCEEKMIKVSKTAYREEMNRGDILPCWSVGRLIEIITICCNHYSGNNDIIFNQAAVNYGMIECLIAYLAIDKKRC